MAHCLASVSLARSCSNIGFGSMKMRISPGLESQGWYRSQGSFEWSEAKRAIKKGWRPSSLISADLHRERGEMSNEREHGNHCKRSKKSLHNTMEMKTVGKHKEGVMNLKHFNRRKNGRKWLWFDQVVTLMIGGPLWVPESIKELCSNEPETGGYFLKCF